MHIAVKIIFLLCILTKYTDFLKNWYFDTQPALYSYYSQLCQEIYFVPETRWAVHLGRRLLGFESFKDSEQVINVYIKSKRVSKLDIRYFHCRFYPPYSSPHCTSTCERKLWVWPTYCQAFQLFIVEELILSFHSSTSDERLKKLDKSIIVSVFITSFLRAPLWKHKSEWISSYTKTETWISESINDVEIEESIRRSESLRYQTLQRHRMGKRRTQTKLWNCWEDNHHSTHYHSPSHSSYHFLSKRNRFIQARRPSCWFESTGVAQKEVQTHFSSYSKVAKLDVHIYSTAILLWYFRYTMVDHRDKWAITYKKSSAWLSA